MKCREEAMKPCSCGVPTLCPNHTWSLVYNTHSWSATLTIAYASNVFSGMIIQLVLMKQRNTRVSPVSGDVLLDR